jgi:putative heme degradation protein
MHQAALHSCMYHPMLATNSQGPALKWHCHSHTTDRPSRDRYNRYDATNMQPAQLLAIAATCMHWQCRTLHNTTKLVPQLLSLSQALAVTRDKHSLGGEGGMYNRQGPAFKS